MPQDYLPKREADLDNFARIFGLKITANPVVVGLNAAQATAYNALNSTWHSAYILTTDNATRTPMAVQAKNSAKDALIDGPGGIRQLVGIIQKFPGTTDAMRVDLGLTVPDAEPSPIPPPAAEPVLSIESTVGRTIKVRLRDKDNPDRRGKPDGVQGATLLYFVGDANPPQDPTQWTFAMNTSRTLEDVDIPATVPAGSKLWLTAQWFNPRKQTSKAAAFQSTRIGDGLAQAA